MPVPGWSRADAPGEFDALGGEGRRHPDVEDDHVDRSCRRAGRAARPGRPAAPRTSQPVDGVEHRPGTLPDEVVVLGDQQGRGHAGLSGAVLQSVTSRGRCRQPRGPRSSPPAAVRVPWWWYHHHVELGAATVPSRASADDTAGAAGTAHPARPAGPAAGRRRAAGEGATARRVVAGRGAARLGAGRPAARAEDTSGGPGVHRCANRPGVAPEPLRDRATIGAGSAEELARVRIAVVGTGISGLASACLLSRRHEVHVFEREPRLGGHTHTVQVPAVRPAATRGRTSGLPSTPASSSTTRRPTPCSSGSSTSSVSRRSRPTCRGRCGASGATSSTPAAPGASSPSRGTWPRPSYLRMLADIARFNRLGPTARRRSPGRDGPARTLPRRSPGSATGSATTTCSRWRPRSGRRGPRSSRPSRSARCCVSSPTTACSASAPTTRGARWSAAPRRTSPPLTAPFAEPHPHAATRSCAVARDRDGVTVRTAVGSQRPVRRGRPRHPRRRVARPAGRPEPRARRSCSAPGRYSDNDTWLHTDTALLPAVAGRLGVVELPARRLSDTFGARVAQLPHEPAPDPRRAARVRRHAEPVHPAARGHASSAGSTYTHPTYTPEAVATQDRLDEPERSATGPSTSVPTSATGSTRTGCGRRSVPSATSGSGGRRDATTRDRSRALRRRRAAPTSPPRPNASATASTGRSSTSTSCPNSTVRCRGFGYRRAALTSFHDTDHFGAADVPVRLKLARWLARPRRRAPRRSRRRS